MRAELLLTNLRLAGFGPGHRIAVADGIVAAILPPSAAEPEAAKVLDLDGDLVLPGLVDGHMHLDKTLFGLPWMPHARVGVSESTRGGSRQWPRGQMVVRVLGKSGGLQLPATPATVATRMRAVPAIPLGQRPRGHLRGVLAMPSDRALRTRPADGKVSCISKRGNLCK